MRNVALAAAVLLSLSACASNLEPPRNPENACAILAERSDYHRAFLKAERKWRIPGHVMMATMYQESSFRGDARPPRKKSRFLAFPAERISSAYGYSQALDGTWSDYTKSAGRTGARRDNIHDAADFMGWYMNESSRALGIRRSDAYSHYLAYHEGWGGYRRGSYRVKGWLMNVARKVEARSKRYSQQLATCR